MTRVKETSLDEILGEFDPGETTRTTGLTGGSVTIWLSAEDKARYDRIQESTGRRFSKKLRELVLAAMDVTEARAG